MVEMLTVSVNVYRTDQLPRSTITPAGGAGVADVVSVGSFGRTTTDADAVAVWPVDEVAVAVHVKTPTSAWLGVNTAAPAGTARLPLRTITPLQE